MATRRGPRSARNVRRTLGLPRGDPYVSRNIDGGIGSAEQGQDRGGATETALFFPGEECAAST
jgi:hypothetical protein